MIKKENIGGIEPPLYTFITTRVGNASQSYVLKKSVYTLDLGVN